MNELYAKILSSKCAGVILIEQNTIRNVILI